MGGQQVSFLNEAGYSARLESGRSVRRSNGPRRRFGLGTLTISPLTMQPKGILC